MATAWWARGRVIEDRASMIGRDQVMRGHLGPIVRA